MRNSSSDHRLRLVEPARDLLARLLRPSLLGDLGEEVLDVPGAARLPALLRAGASDVALVGLADAILTRELWRLIRRVYRAAQRPRARRIAV